MPRWRLEVTRRYALDLLPSRETSADLKWPRNGQAEIIRKKPTSVSRWHKMAARVGIEPASVFLQAALSALGWESEDKAGAQHSAQILGELAVVAAGWGNLSPEMRFAVMALVRAGGRP